MLVAAVWKGETSKNSENSNYFQNLDHHISSATDSGESGGDSGGGGGGGGGASSSSSSARGAGAGGNIFGSYPAAAAAFAAGTSSSASFSVASCAVASYSSSVADRHHNHSAAIIGVSDRRNTGASSRSSSKSWLSKHNKKKQQKRQKSPSSSNCDTSLRCDDCGGDSNRRRTKNSKRSESGEINAIAAIGNSIAESGGGAVRKDTNSGTGNIEEAAEEASSESSSSSSSSSASASSATTTNMTMTREGNVTPAPSVAESIAPVIAKANGYADDYDYDGEDESATIEIGDSSRTTDVRESWSSKWDFMMSCIGYAVGLGNIWRFPYLCYKNGGGAFLIPYFICLIFAGVPVFFMETALGQLLGRGMLSIWHICPALKGVGYSSLILLFWMNSYYVVVIAWSIYYFVHSISPFTIPWSDCTHAWNTIHCRSDSDIHALCSDFLFDQEMITTTTTTTAAAAATTMMMINQTEPPVMQQQQQPQTPLWSADIMRELNITISDVVRMIEIKLAQYNRTIDETRDYETIDRCIEAIGGSGANAVDVFTDPVREYWERNVLQTSPGIDYIGTINVGLMVAMFVAWAICYWAMFRGIQMTGKIIYFTAMFPYFCLAILFVRGVTLDGALTGLEYFFRPNLKQILDPNVWNDAASQIFFSYGLGVGAWIALSSYNKFDNNVLKDTIVISAINGGTAVFSGVIVFCIVGFMAKQQNKPIESVAASGSGLTFIAYPSATLKMPFVHVWSALFFAMMIMLGLGSLFVQLESFFTGLVDEFSDLLRKRRAFFILCVCAISSTIGIIFVTNAGIYWFEIFNYYAASGFALLCLVFFESIAIFWFYGSKRFIERVEYMLQRKISIFWTICWKYLGPVICMAIFIFSLIRYKAPDYNGYKFPTWAIGVGWFLALSSMLAVPVYVVLRFITIKGSLKQKWSKLWTPRYAEIDRIVRERARTVPKFPRFEPQN